MAANELATEAQTGFIQSLIRERDTDKLEDTQRTWLEEQDFTRLTRAQATRVIAGLKELPRQLKATKGGGIGNPNWVDVRAGRYAAAEADGVLRFYKVDRPEEGRWAGYIFVAVQASEELYPIKDKARKAAVLSLLAQDPKEAMLRWGREIGSCGHCGRTLTNELSREIGIGPICRAKLEW